MLKKIVIISSVTCAATLISCGANAALAQSRGFYLEGNVGWGHVGVDVNNNTGLTGSANVGYKFCDFFALEGGGALLPNIKYAKENYYFDVAGKAIAPVSKGFDLFAKAGAAWVHSNFFEESAYAALFVGGGVDYSFTPNVVLVVQATATSKYHNDIPAMIAGTVGLNFIL